MTDPAENTALPTLRDHVSRASDPAAEARLLAALEADPRFEQPPPAAWRRSAASLAAAVVLLGVGGALLWPPPMQPRGLDGPALPTTSVPRVDLRLARYRSAEHVEPLSEGPLPVGAQVLFRVSASEASPLWVWVDGPGGLEPIQALEVAGGVPVDLLGSGGQAVVYRFDAPGHYSLIASAEDGACSPTTCSMVQVEVR